MSSKDLPRRLRSQRPTEVGQDDAPDVLAEFNDVLSAEDDKDDMEWYAEFPANKILSRLYLGNIYNAMELAYNGNPLKITAVLNVSTEEEYDKNPDILYLHIPFPDGHEVPARKFAECLAYLRYCWENGHTILVHCAAGISRSTSIVVSFLYYMKLMKAPITTFDQTLDFVKMCRPIVMPNPSVIGSCRRWLRVWPHDGSMGKAEPEGKLENTIQSLPNKWPPEIILDDGQTR